METQSTLAATTAAAARLRGHAIVRVLAGGARFVGSFLLMCGSMCMGGALLATATLAAFGAAGHPVPGRDFPELTILILAVEITLPMTAVMLVLRHPVRHNVEMSAVSVGAGGLVLIGYWLAIVSPGTVASRGLFGLMCGVLCAGMALDMAVHLKHYTGWTDHAAHHGHSAVAG